MLVLKIKTPEKLKKDFHNFNVKAKNVVDFLVNNNFAATEKPIDKASIGNLTFFVKGFKTKCDHAKYDWKTDTMIFYTTPINEGKKDYFSCDQTIENANKLKQYLHENCIYFEPSENFNKIHFEILLNEIEYNIVNEWIEKNLF